MAIKGTFLADFASFSAAVQKAEVELRGMETGAGKVEKSLNRVADSFSGRKIIQDATLAAEAVDRIGGVSKLTEAEQARLNRTVTEALAKYKALGKEAPEALIDIEQATRKIPNTAPGFFADLTSQVKATALGFISAQAIIGTVQTGVRLLTDFVGSSIDAYAAQETAVKKMTTALRAQGQATPEVIAQYEKLASQFQNTTVNSDELINEMQALLVEVGGVMPDEMEKALQAATDLSAGLGIDLRTATLLVGKAFAGETGTLKKYGIVIDENKLKTEGATAVMSAIQEKFGGQAQSEVDTYAGRVKQLGNAWDEVKEAVGKSIVQNPIVVRLMRELTEAVKAQGAETEASKGKWTDWLGVVGWAIERIQARQAAINKGIEDAAEALARAMRGAKAALDSLGGPPQSLKDGQQFILDLRRTSKLTTDEMIDGWIKTGKAVDAHTEKIRALADIYSGASAITKAKDTLEALGVAHISLATLTRLSKEQQAELFRIVDDGIGVFARQGKVAPQAMRDLWMATMPAITVTSGLGDSIKALGQNVAVTLPDLTNYVGLIKVVSGLQSGFDAGRTVDLTGFQEWAIAAAKAAEETKKAKEEASEAQDALDALAAAFMRLGATIGGTAGKMAQVGGQWYDAVVAAKEYQTVANTAAGATAVQSLTMYATAIGVVYTGWKAIIAISNKLDPMAGAWAQTVMRADGSLKAFSMSAQLAGQDVNKLFDIAKPDDFAAALKRTQQAIADNERMMSAYGLTWRDFGGMTKEWVSTTARDLLRDFQTLTQRGVNATTAIKGMSGSLSQLVVDAVKTGTKIPAALQPILDQMIRMGTLTDAAARAMLGLADDSMPSLEDIKAAAERYGLTLDDLGQKVQQLQISKLAGQIIKDFDLLIRAGADVGVVMLSMKTDVQKLVTQALALGLALPESMRPLIDQMIAAGLLTDEFGEKLTDTSRINFAKSLTDKIDELIGKLGELIDQWDKMGDAAERAGSRARNGLPQTGTAQPRDQGADTPGFASGTGGKFLDFGAGTRVTLHGRERVMTAAEDGGSDVLEVHSHLYLDGRQVTTAVERIQINSTKDRKRFNR